MTGVHFRACRPGVWPPYFTDVTPNREQGFVPALMRLLSGRANFTLEWLPFDQAPFLTGQMSYVAQAFDLVAQGTCDLIILSADNPADYRAQYADGIQVVPTQPFVQLSYSILVKKEMRASAGWQMLEPFESELWAAIMGTWLVIAMSIAVIQATQSCVSGPRQLVLLVFRSLYYSGAALLGGDTNEWVRWPSKVVHVGVLVFTLVVLASYTASLTAFITRPSWHLVGPLNRAELAQQPLCVSNAAQGAVVEALTGSAHNAIVAPIETVAAGGPLLALQWCAEQVELGTAAGIFTVDTEALAFLESGGCDGFGHAPALKKLATTPLSFFVGHHTGHNAFVVADKLTRALLTMQMESEYYMMLEDYGMAGYVCPDERSGEPGVEPRLQVQHLSGLFVATFGMLGIAVLGALAERAFLSPGRSAERDKEVQGSSSRALEEVEVEVADTRPPTPPASLENSTREQRLSQRSQLLAHTPASLKDAQEQCSQLLSLLRRMDEPESVRSSVRDL